jgi:nitrite reductase/ring-hydroxylating ferredoxin subunit
MPSSPSDCVQRVRDHLAALRALPQERAAAMPAEYYTSPEFLNLERDELFRKQWIGIGHVGEIPKPGDYFTTELVDEQLIVARGTDKSIRVLSNVCRHRGSVIARGTGNAKRFICPYHAWTYGLDGNLIAAPLMDRVAHFERTRCRLPQFRLEIWEGFIFVNLDREATTPLASQIAATEPYIRNYRPAERHLLFNAEEVWQTNWKCLVENFMEGYHLSPMHAKTLHAVTPTELCEKLPHGSGYTGYRANFSPSCPERGPYTPDLTEKERRSDVFYCIYPSFVVGFCPHFTLYMCLRPLTVNTVGIRWGITGVADDPNSKVVKDYVQLCKDFSAEDRAQLEQLFLGLKSRHYVPGPLAPDAFEGTIWDMLGYMAERLGHDG